MLLIMGTARFAAGEEPTAGYAVLKTHCFKCHADEFRQPGLDLRDREGLIAAKKEAAAYLVPGKADDSRIWQVIRTGLMPPADNVSHPTVAEGETLKRWIDDGAEFPKSDRVSRKFIGERTTFEMALKDLEKQPERNRKFIRYFSLLHLWNSNLDDENLRILRAACSKLINSLSSEREIVAPQPVDNDGLLLRIDLRDYGWKYDVQWHDLLTSYHYSLKTNDPNADAIKKITGSELSILRADWFVFHGSRPPLYHKLLTLPGADHGLPATQQELEKLLDVNLQQNIQESNVLRGGLSGENSGPSEHTRIGERHKTKYGYYWVSYDSSKDRNRQIFFQFPLGPTVAGAANIGAFEHDGGELIFSLPNGLQGYLLVKSNGARIDDGPLDIVSDPNQFAGSNIIVNGISCMGCHRLGIINFTDAIRAQYAMNNSAIAKRVRELYGPQDKLEKAFEKDQEQFEKALGDAVRPFLKQTGRDKNAISNWVEPIQAASKRYGRPVKLEDIARELGLPEDSKVAEESGIFATESELRTAIKFSRELRRSQLQPLLKQQSIPRSHWETEYPSTAMELGLGTPLDVK